MVGVKHTTVVVIPDDGSSAVGTDEWNANHTIDADTFSNTELSTGTYSKITGVGAQSQDLDMNTHKITNVTDPAADQDAATKAYVDNLLSGLKFKASVRVATTAAGTLATDYENGDTLDGIVLATGDRILIKNQADQTTNGIYVVAASGAPTRSTDADAASELPQMAVFVREGTTNADSGWVLTTDGTITLGVSNLTFEQFSGAGQITAGSGISKTGNTLAVDATVIRTTGAQSAQEKKLTDANGNEVLDATGSVASAVNQVKVTNAATGTAPIISADGDDANIDLNLRGKGTGKVTINDATTPTKKLTIDLSGATGATTATIISSQTVDRSYTLPDATTTLVGTDVTQTESNKTFTRPKIADAGSIDDENANEQIKFSTTASAVNEITVKNAATGNYPQIQGTGGDANIGLKFVPKGAAHGIVGVMETFTIAISDETTAITTGTAKVTFRMPYAFTVVKVKASLSTASSSGTPTFDINDGGTSIMTTNKLVIDANELTTATAATAAAITDSALADDAEITIDIDTAGTGAKGAKVYIIGYATAIPA